MHLSKKNDLLNNSASNIKSCYVKQLDLSKIVEKGKSIQSEARDLRYQWFDEMMSKINADVLLTAHHLNDQLETIFIAFYWSINTQFIRNE